MWDYIKKVFRALVFIYLEKENSDNINYNNNIIVIILWHNENPGIVRTVYSGILRHIQGHSAIFSHVQANLAIIRHIEA